MKRAKRRRPDRARQIAVILKKDIPKELREPLEYPLQIADGIGRMILRRRLGGHIMGPDGTEPIFTARFDRAMLLFDLKAEDLAAGGRAVAWKILAQVFPGLSYVVLPRRGGREADNIWDPEVLKRYVKAIRLRAQDSTLTPAAAWKRVNSKMDPLVAGNQWLRLRRDPILKLWEESFPKDPDETVAMVTQVLTTYEAGLAELDAERAKLDAKSHS